MGERKTIETDVLVIGGGVAGNAAALTAAEAGVRVMQLYKGPATSAISTGFLTYPVEGRFGRDQLEETLLNVTGKGLCDRALMNRFLSESSEEVQAAIRRYGIPVDEAPRGVRARRAVGRRGKELVGEDYSVAGVRDMTSVVMEFSATHGTSLFSGSLKAVLAESIQRDKGTALKISPDGSSVIALIDGDFAWISTKAIVLATGGVQGLYEFTDNPPSLIGDGHAMALEAGAALTDMEFIQFYPLALAEEGAPAIFIYPDFPPGGRIVNGAGTDILQKHFDGSQTLGEFDNWDYLSVVLQQEIMEGQDVYIDFTGTAPEAWSDGSLTKLFLDKYAPGYMKRVVRVSPIAHYTIGGVGTNAECETDVPGLYAVGEVAGGLHGANRHGGVALAEGVTFGRIAGRNAAAHSTRHHAASCLDDSFEQSKPGLAFNAGDVMAALRRMCQKMMGPLRDGPDLKKMELQLLELTAEAEEFGWDNPTGYARVLAYKRSLMLAESMRCFMLNRTESRGVHFRRDYPEIDREWLMKQVMILGSDGKPVFKKKAV